MIRFTPSTAATRRAFTLVELLVAIAIIGILMSIAIPAVMRSITTARVTSMRMEISALEQAVEQYLQKHGDYPPDGSDWNVLSKHMRRLYPRMADQPDFALLKQLTHSGTGTLVLDPTNAAFRSHPTFSAVAMDRGEALVFFLGGFSTSKQNPLTGEGGPLQYVSGDVNDLTSYQYNGTRDNRLFDFDVARLTTVRLASGRLMSSDETALGVANPMHGGVDALPSYVPRSSNPTPYVYFDSRTYTTVGGGLANGYVAGTYGTSEYGAIRPYLTGVQAPVGSEVLSDYQFHKPDSFQIISPGLDGVFGAIVSVDSTNAAADAVYFATEKGQPVSAVALPASVRTATRFQDGDWLSSITVNGHLDNVTNFSTSTLEDDLQ